ITIDGNLLTVLKPRKTGDKIFDHTLDILNGAKKAKDMEYWINALWWKSKPIYEGLLESLINRGILKKEEGRILWIIKTKSYPMQYDAPEKEIRARIRGIVLKGKPVDPRTMMLISLVDACSLVPEVFRAKEEQEKAQETIKKLSTELGEGRLINEMTHGIHAATLAAITTNLLTATSAATSAALTTTMTTITS
ncbi:MAG: GPP34 family phosphoprotein, partial [bacterium]|nr:GPP34 family phosphoprotein [bacterium]